MYKKFKGKDCNPESLLLYLLQKGLNNYTFTLFVSDSVLADFVNGYSLYKINAKHK